jgi:hypothetical protein
MIAIGGTPLTEETAPELITDLRQSHGSRAKDLLNQLVTKGQVQAALAQLRQHRINQAHAQIETRMVEGLGQKVAEIDLGVFFQMRNQHGHNCWHDPDFIAAFLRDNPACALKLHTTFYWNGVNFGNRNSDTGLRKEKQKR